MRNFEKMMRTAFKQDDGLAFIASWAGLIVMILLSVFFGKLALGNNWEDATRATFVAIAAFTVLTVALAIDLNIIVAAATALAVVASIAFVTTVVGDIAIGAAILAFIFIAVGVVIATIGSKISFFKYLLILVVEAGAIGGAVIYARHEIVDSFVAAITGLAILVAVRIAPKKITAA